MGNSYSDDSKPSKGKNSVSKPFVNSLTKPVEKEIIIKCSVEEMTKAFFKDYVIVWHDPNVESKENQEYIAQLKKFCEVFTLTEWEKALAFIKETIAVCHVITSGTDGELLVKEVSERENVCNIYVFCRNKEYHEGWAKNYPKISCIETHIQRLFNQIQQNLLEWYKKASSLNYNLPAFAPIFDDSDKSEMNHLHRYLKVIPNFKNREQAKEDFINLSKVIYSDPSNQGFIAGFEKNYNQYNKDNTLRWYTLESFLYKVTNNCLRIATSDSIQYCRLPLKDIEQAIKDQYQAKSKNFNGLLYRGAYLSEQEWLSLKENQDKEIEMHGFLSVSKVKNVALNFMNTDPTKKVFITIIVPKGPNDEEQGFAEIEEYSQYPQEKEILFNVRSRFTVLETEDDYEYSGGTSRCRHLVLLYGAQGFLKFLTEQNPAQDVSIPNMEGILCAHCNVKSLEMPEKFLFVSIADGHHYCKPCTDCGVGPFLCIPMSGVGGSYKAKIKGCLLMNPSQGQFYGYKCCKCQAKGQKSYFICTDCGAKEKKWCENCFEKETFPCMEAGHNVLLETSPFSFWCERMSQSESNHLNFQNDLVQKGGDLFQQAEMYFESHQYEKAIEYYNLYIQQNEAKGKDINLATSYNHLGAVYKHQGEYKKALEYFLKSLDILQSVFGGDNHPDIGAIYNNMGQVYQNQAEYNKALDYYLKSLDISKSLYGENHQHTAVVYHNIGTIYLNQGDHKKALECYLKSLEIKGSVFGGENHPEVAPSLSTIGLAYQRQGEYNKALEYYFKALDMYKSIYGQNHPEVANSCDNIGWAFKDQGEYEKALEYHLEALEIRKTVYGGHNHADIAFSYHHLAQVYQSQGEFQKALEYSLKSLDIFKSVDEENHPSVFLSYSTIGYAYKGQGELQKALEYFLKSLDIQKSTLGENHPGVAASYKEIGELCNIQGDYMNTVEYYLKLLDIYEAIHGKYHPLVASCCNNIGSVYLKQGELSKALEYTLKSLDIEKAMYGDNHPVVASSCDNIGLVYQKLGEYEKALEYSLECLKIRKSIYGDHHPQTALAYKSIASVYHDQGKSEKALEYDSKCLDILESANAENPVDTAASYEKIGMAYEEQGEYDKALECYLLSLDIKRSFYEGENHPDFVTSYDNIGSAYDNQGEYEKALEYYFKSLEILKSTYEENHPDIAACYDKIGAVYENQEEYENALECYFRALEVYKSAYGDDSLQVANSCDNIGSIYRDQREYDKAIEYFLLSLDIKRSLYEDENHPDIAASYDNVGGVYESQGEFEKALEYDLKSLDIKRAVYGEDHFETIDTQDIIDNIQLRSQDKQE